MRAPIEREVRGLQTPRERIWTAIRTLKKGFSRLSVQDHCMPMVPHTAVRDYMEELESAGFIKLVGTDPKRTGQTANLPTSNRYDLVRTQFEAPRLNGGSPVSQGLGVLAMWRAMKVLRKGFDYHDIAAAASVDGFVVKPQTAKSYVVALARAGFFQELSPPKPGTAARYRLAKDTGPHAPAITRQKVVFDRNTGQFAALETAQEVCDGIAE